MKTYAKQFFYMFNMFQKLETLPHQNQNPPIMQDVFCFFVQKLIFGRGWVLCFVPLWSIFCHKKYVKKEKTKKEKVVGICISKLLPRVDFANSSRGRGGSPIFLWMVDYGPLFDDLNL